MLGLGLDSSSTAPQWGLCSLSWKIFWDRHQSELLSLRQRLLNKVRNILLFIESMAICYWRDWIQEPYVCLSWGHSLSLWVNWHLNNLHKMEQHKQAGSERGPHKHLSVTFTPTVEIGGSSICVAWSWSWTRDTTNASLFSSTLISHSRRLPSGAPSPYS